MENPYKSPKTLAPRVMPSPIQSKVWSGITICILGVLIPGLPSFFMRSSKASLIRSGSVFFAIPFSFFFFGPIWDIFIFPDSPIGLLGFYPFLVTCLIVPVLSIWFGFLDRAQLVAALRSEN